MLCGTRWLSHLLRFSLVSQECYLSSLLSSELQPSMHCANVDLELGDLEPGG